MKNLIEKVAEWLYVQQYKTKDADEIKKLWGTRTRYEREQYMEQAREIVALFQPMFNEIADLSSRISALCFTLKTPEISDLVNQILSLITEPKQDEPETPKTEHEGYPKINSGYIGDVIGKLDRIIPDIHERLIKLESPPQPPQDEPDSKREQHFPCKKCESKGSIPTIIDHASHIPKEQRKGMIGGFTQGWKPCPDCKERRTKAAMEHLKESLPKENDDNEI